MIGRLVRFELRYWLRQPMVYIFLLINLLLCMGAVSSDNIQIGGGLGSVYRNAPEVIYNFYALMSFLGLLMVTAFVNGTAIRDFSNNTAQLVFATPISRRQYLIGRFAGSTIVALVPMLGISLGILLGSVVPWADAERMGPTLWNAHAQAFLLYAVPNVLFTAAVIFGVAIHARNTIAAFITAIVLLVGYIIAQNLIGDLDNEFLAAMLDPFGITALSQVTKYWTVADKNTLLLPMDGPIGWNRLLWVAVSIVVFVVAYRRFSFHERARKGGAKQGEATSASMAHIALPNVSRHHGTGARWKQFIAQVRMELKAIVTGPVFIVVMLLGVIQLITSLAYVTELYDNVAYPVTYNVIDTIENALGLYVIIIVVFYSGLLVWRERDPRMHDIHDALPLPTGLGILAKMTSMLALLTIVFLLATAAGMLTQLANGYTVLRPEVYFWYLIVPGILGFGFLSMLAICVHTLVNNKYLGYFVFILIVVLNAFAWPALDIESRLVRMNSDSGLRYSDLSRFGPYVKGFAFFKAYWWAFGGILLFVSFLFRVRGRETGAKWRMRIARWRLSQRWKVALPLVLLWAGLGAWGYYNTKVLNTYTTSDQGEELRVRYEKEFKRFDGIPQPHFTAVDYDIALYPEERRMEYTAQVTTRNVDAVSIDSLHLLLPDDVDLEIDLPGGELVLNDDDLDYRIYRLDPPLAPGAELPFTVRGSYAAKGFEHRISFIQLVNNGSFFNNTDLVPGIGYNAGAELSDRNDRRKHDLPPKERMTPLSEDPALRQHTYLMANSDWVDVRTHISTAGDQIAVAPGSLRKQWTEDGRNHFEYALDHPSQNFYSFLSARYEVAREQWTPPGGGTPVDVEVYYHHEHGVNVPRMIASMKQALAYYTQHFGPYRHRQVRILEFPRYFSFAQAFPGTMPYSESIGFITDLSAESDIDMVFYVVAHEMGHQWWAHQVIGADMQGGTLLSESMSQYSALMVMEQEYGRAHMRKFLKLENDKYMRARGSETQRELPLLRVENQGYIHYNKGSVVLYALREFLGEDTLNKAFRSLVDSFAYQGAPYPTSMDLYRAVDHVTPDSLHYLLEDQLAHITLYDNRLLSATAVPSGRGYDVTVKLSCAKFHADSLGRETTMPMNDWIDVGLQREAVDDEDEGELIVQRRIRFTEGEHTVTFHVDELPHEAVIDPMHLFFDRVPDDNAERVEKPDA